MKRANLRRMRSWWEDGCACDSEESLMRWWRCLSCVDGLPRVKGKSAACSSGFVRVMSCVVLFFLTIDLLL